MKRSIILLLSMTLLLCACGQSGRLYLPKEESDQTPATVKKEE